jgi:small nuclear ribonucleoprotein (snRNP)-like protein
MTSNLYKKYVVVRLKDGREFAGTLLAYDYNFDFIELGDAIRILYTLYTSRNASCICNNIGIEEFVFTKYSEHALLTGVRDVLMCSSEAETAIKSIISRK